MPKHTRPRAVHGKTIRGKSAARNTKGLKRGGSPGRPKGVPNKATMEAKELCSRVVDDPSYFSKLKARAIAGKLAPAVETMVWHYAKGKPKDLVELSGRVDGIGDIESDVIRAERIRRLPTDVLRKSLAIEEEILALMQEQKELTEQ